MIDLTNCSPWQNFHRHQWRFPLVSPWEMLRPTCSTIQRSDPCKCDPSLSTPSAQRQNWNLPRMGRLRLSKEGFCAIWLYYLFLHQKQSSFNILLEELTRWAFRRDRFERRRQWSARTFFCFQSVIHPKMFHSGLVSLFGRSDEVRVGDLRSSK